jgi:hypothetical protein
VNTAAIEVLWQKYLRAYAQPQICSELQSRWGNDPNVVQARIQLGYPPTFQPGYIGTRFFEASARVLFIGHNPGEGKLQSSQDEDKALSKNLNAFAEGQLSFTQLAAFQAGHVIKWPIYREKGIFLETGDASIALLPTALRPSIQAVALLNLFPFKTVSNKKPLSGYGGSTSSLKAHMWECLVKPTIEALDPRFIVRYPDSDQYLPQLEQLKSKPRLVRVWHPSDYSLSAQRNKLANSWSPLATEIASHQ